MLMTAITKKNTMPVPYPIPNGDSETLKLRTETVLRNEVTPVCFIPHALATSDQSTCNIHTPTKFDMEPENKSSGKGKPFWKP